MVDKEVYDEPRIYGVLDDKVEARRWTNESRDCYLRKCKCRGCANEKFFRESRQDNPQLGLGYRCRCKAVVVKLIRNIGLPETNVDYNSILEEET